LFVVRQIFFTFNNSPTRFPHPLAAARVNKLPGHFGPVNGNASLQNRIDAASEKNAARH
jgi:hypothetical protein